MGLSVAHPGPCAEAPHIAVGPTSSTKSLDDSLGLDCEVHGVPVPSVTWLFLALDGSTQTLPGHYITISHSPTSSIVYSFI